MTESEAKISTIAEDYKTVLHEAKSMGCNDIRALYNIPIKNMELIVQALEEIRQYRTIGTVEECREAVEKQKPKKVIEKFKAVAPEDIEAFGKDAMFGHCPVCKNLQSSVWNSVNCGDCGQKLDWSGSDEQKFNGS